MDNTQLAQTIMKRVSTSLFESNEIKEAMSPAKGYTVKCSAINDQIASIIKDLNGVDLITSNLKSKSEPSEFLCTNEDSLLNLLQILIKNDVLKPNALYNIGTPSISIMPAYSPSINDSLHEAKKTTFTPSMHYKGDTPRSYHKRVLLDEIKHDRIKRDPEVIAQYLIDKGVWDETTSEKRKERDVQDILDKSEGYGTYMAGDFITDYIFTKEDDFYRGQKKNITESEAVACYVQYLIDNNLRVEIQKRTFSTVIKIHYEGKLQYDILVKWLLWHLGLSENIQAGGLKSQFREAAELAIASGRYCTYHYNDIYPNRDDEDVDLTKYYMESAED